MSVTSMLEVAPLSGSIRLNSFGSHPETNSSPRRQVRGGSNGSATGSHSSQKLYQGLIGLSDSTCCPQRNKSTYLRKGLPAVMKALTCAAAKGGNWRRTSSP